MTVTVRKVDGRLAIIIPAAVARDMDLTEGTTLHVSAVADMIVMRRKARLPRRPLAEILDGIQPAAYRRLRRELSDTPPAGREVW
jgi:AbrB family looped-hinge helix DNA binding protein